VARDNPDLMVSLSGAGAEVVVSQMERVHGRSRRDEDPRLERRRQRDMEEEYRRRKYEEKEAARKKKKADEEAAVRRAKAAEDKKRQDAGLAERRKADEEKKRERRERLGLPPTATAEECIKREKEMAKREKEGITEPFTKIEGTARKTAHAAPKTATQMKAEAALKALLGGVAPPPASIPKRVERDPEPVPASDPPTKKVRRFEE